MAKCSKRGCNENAFKRCSVCGKEFCVNHIDYYAASWICRDCIKK